MISTTYRIVATSEQGGFQRKSNSRLSGETISLKKELDSIAASNE